MGRWTENLPANTTNSCAKAIRQILSYGTYGSGY